jgi:hypothetical protein
MQNGEEPKSPDRPKRQPPVKTGSLFLAIPVMLVSAVAFIPFPDSDIRVLGIGWHRFFLTHSAIVPILIYLLALVRRFHQRVRAILGALAAGSAASIGIHLLTDIIPKKAIRFPIIGNLWYGSYLDDRSWIVGNALLCAWLVYVFVKRLSGK